MMKKNSRILYLVRHAKASRKYSNITDFDRPLTEVGYEESYRMANELRQNGEVPDLMISSTAIRALSSALIFRKVLGLPDNKLQLIDRLYEIYESDLIDLVSDLDNSYQSVMLFGHNPSFSQLAGRFNNEINHIPTAGVVKFNFLTDKWNQCSYINAENQLFLIP
jgi:phosphohistidine phosphatase